MSKSTEVILEGKVVTEPVVVSEYGKEKIYSIDIKTKRLSGVVDTFSVNFSSGFEVSIEVGMFIKVEGSLRSAKINDVPRLFINSDVITVLDSEPEEYINIAKVYNAYLLDKPSIRKAYNNNSIDVCDFCVKVQRAYNKSCYIHCSAWKNNARLIGKMNQGDTVSIEGRLQSHVNRLGNTLVNMSVVSFMEEDA